MPDLALLLAQTTHPATDVQHAAAAGGARGFLISLAYLVAAGCFIFGLKMLRAPLSARRGNALAATGMLIAVVATVCDPRIMGGRALGWGTVLAGMAVGGVAGALMALRVHMKGMPQMVALFNGFGGLAAALVGMGEYLREAYSPAGIAADVSASAAASIVIGMITFTGSLVAFAKLQEMKLKVLGQSISGPVKLPVQLVLNFGGAALILVLCIVIAASAQAGWAAGLVMLLAAIYGLIFVLPIGGADMPVVIALLNSFSGLGAAATGMVLHNNALIIGGSLVGASGLILTFIMCRAMNRSLVNVLVGGFGQSGGAPAAASGAAPKGNVQKMDPEEAAMVLEAAQNVIIIPGYGMAVAQAQHAVMDLAKQLTAKGASVKFAVHPVAGRMPGHMNVLLAEANAPYEMLHDLDINPEFQQCDVALVIGANDVVNPAARHDKASPIYGMPIFDADKARTVMVSKRSMSAGYAGVENELFYLPNCVMLFGDAKQMMTAIVGALKGGH
jgi:NAD(P) transhydrogenase subunit beta